MAMRLLHVTQRYPPAIGGAEKYIADLSEELVRRGQGAVDRTLELVSGLLSSEAD